MERNAVLFDISSFLFGIPLKLKFHLETIPRNRTNDKADLNSRMSAAHRREKGSFDYTFLPTLGDRPLFTMAKQRRTEFPGEEEESMLKRAKSNDPGAFVAVGTPVSGCPPPRSALMGSRFLWGAGR